MDHVVLFLLFTYTTIIRTCCGVCSPGSVTERGVSDRDKITIIQIHNYFRKQNALGKVTAQPKASNMLKLTWDESLAQKAQEIAETCEFRHVKVKDPRFLVGQNLYTYSTTANKLGANWNRAVKNWFDENKTYRFSKSLYNHYTQVIWANSYKVGCGYVKFKIMNAYQSLYVCHYGPAGNMYGEIPYMIGYGCENLCEISNNDKTAEPEEEARPVQTNIPPISKWNPKAQYYIYTILHLLNYLIKKQHAELMASRAQQVEYPNDAMPDHYTQTHQRTYYGQSYQPHQVYVYGKTGQNMQNHNYEMDYLKPQYDQRTIKTSFYMYPINENPQITMKNKNIDTRKHHMYNPAANQFTNQIMNEDQKYYEQPYYRDANGQQNYRNAHNYNNQIHGNEYYGNNQNMYYYSPYEATRKNMIIYGR